MTQNGTQPTPQPTGLRTDHAEGGRVQAFARIERERAAETTDPRAMAMFRNRDRLSEEGVSGTDIGTGR